MRFNRLDILRYGALTNRTVVFRPDAKLHVVYGPNEAGKSSALSAISDLLFGFSKVGEKSFLHRPNMLRVGGELASRTGQVLTFRRKNGQKNTILRDQENEEALPEDALAPFLGSLSRDVFERAFGLDSTSLRAGGETMLRSGGEIGSLLFSAASGLTGLSDLRKQLEAEADSIYAPRRSKDRLFYQVLDAHDEARRAERESELKSIDWKNLLKEQVEIEADLATVQQDRQETKRALDRLRKLLALEPVLREIDRERALLEGYEAYSDLPAEFEERLADAMAAAGRNALSRQSLQTEVERLAAEIGASRVDEALLMAVPRIVAAHSEMGAYLKAREDIARVGGEVDEFDLRLSQAARRLGCGSVEELQRIQPTDADLARLRTLVDEGTGLDRDLQQLRQRIHEEQDILRRLNAEGIDGRVMDPKPWTEQLAALRPDLAAIGDMEAVEVRAARAEANFAAAAGRLDPPARDVEKLLTSPLPDLATLIGHRRLIEEAQVEHTAAQQKLLAIGDELKAVAYQMASLEEQGRIVSPQDIAAARDRRDEQLVAVRSEPSNGALNTLKDAIDEADQLADAALADAERVSRHAHLRLRERELESQLASAAASAKEAEIAASDAVTAFEDLFHATPVSPSTPERMIEWRRAVEGLSVLFDAANDVKDELQALRLKEQKLRPSLGALAEALGVNAATLPTAALARAVERRLAEVSERWLESRAIAGKRHSAEETLVRLEEREVALKCDLDRWRNDFAAAASSIGLPEDAAADMAIAALDVWRVVPDLLSERENRNRRVRGMARDMERFEGEVGDLCREVGADLLSIPADVAAGLLNERAMAAKAEENRRAALSADLTRADEALLRLREEAEAIQTQLGSLAQTRSRPVSELAAVVEDLRQRNHIQAALRQCRARFAEQSDGADEEEVRAGLVGFDRVAAALEIERLEAEDGRQVDRISSLRAKEAENVRRRRELESGIGAERAVYQKLSAEEDAKQLARRWVVLKLAASLLANSMEAYRERQADPVMKRAGQLFSALTGNRFARLVQVYDEKDELQLAAERNNGEQVSLPGLSEGTCDQLYLSLRLAFLEDYCSRNEPAPLVLDDIFQTFDDERTAAGLRTLADAGGTFQTILFTHQLSLVETARREVGDALDVVSLEQA